MAPQFPQLPPLPPPEVVVGNIVNAIKGAIGAITKPITDAIPGLNKPNPAPPAQPSITVPPSTPPPSPTAPEIIPFTPIATSSPIAAPHTTIPVPIVITSSQLETESLSATSDAEFSSSEATTISSSISLSTVAMSGVGSSTTDSELSATQTLADPTAVGSPPLTTSPISEHSDTSLKLAIILPATLIPTAVISFIVLCAIGRCRLRRNSNSGRSYRFNGPRSAAAISPFTLPIEQGAPTYHTALHPDISKRPTMGLSLETNLTGLRFQGHATRGWMQQPGNTHDQHSYSPVTTSLPSPSDFMGPSNNLGTSSVRADDTISPASSLTGLAPLRMASEASPYPTTDSDSDSMEPPTNLISRIFRRAVREPTEPSESARETEQSIVNEMDKELTMLRQKVEMLEGELREGHRSESSTSVSPFNSEYPLDRPPDYASHVEAGA